MDLLRGLGPVSPSVLRSSGRFLQYDRDIAEAQCHVGSPLTSALISPDPRGEAIAHSPATPRGHLASFDTLNLIDPLRRALADAGYEEPTAIQAEAIPPLLEGRDVLGCAQTGTGKTAAFALPVLQKLSTREEGRGKVPIRALVLSPTRELAAQIGASFQAYGAHLSIRSTVIFGGVGQNPQVRVLNRGVDILVATPGRLLDLINQGYIRLDQVEFFVLDEADRMLDMGFIHDLRKILPLLPRKRQNLLFSATMPKSIVKLAGDFLHEPVRVEVQPESSTVEKIDQYVLFVEKSNKRALLAQQIESRDIEMAIVFSRTKHGANRIVQFLDRSGITAAAIHGNKSQGARERALNGFRKGAIRVLVATDVASRGIDIDGVTHVFNLDLPNEPEVYVHRIGRTGRAGADGIAISFCDEGEGGYLRDIERLTGRPLQVQDHPYYFEGAVPLPGARGKPKDHGNKRRQPRRFRGRSNQGGGGRGRGRGR